MPDLPSRCAWLLAAVQAEPGPVTTRRAEQLLATTSWSCHRNTARKSLRTLHRRGLLRRATGIDGRCTYQTTTGRGVRS